MTDKCVLIIGAGRMGRGIAQSYSLAGFRSVLVDLKQRSAADFDALAAAVSSDIEADLKFTVELGYLDAKDLEKTLARVSTIQADQFDAGSTPLAIAFEALPETLDLKQQAFAWANESLRSDTIIASTTSTLDVNELAALVDKPERFLNAHWLNPAHLMPLVEVAVGDKTSDTTYRAVHESLQAVGKVPVKCAASPGYIVPRIQALAMNEAARLVEEGVATAEDVDTAVRVGFGLRFAVLGLLEFIDWGGNDILYYASKHMSRTVDAARYRAPRVIEDNMQKGRNGLREGQGFYDYDDVDVDQYRRERLAQFLNLVEYSDLLPAGLKRREDEAVQENSE